MPLLERFFRTIDRIGAIQPPALDALARLNPEKFYLENVRSVLGVSHSRALEICEAAVRQGVFQAGVEVACPDGSVAATADDESELPESIHCWTDDSDGHCEEIEVPTASCRKTRFYRLV